ncbi:MAG TPA: glycosyltransferase family 2 protein [Candidatus Woesebacteria bacterium]|nr:glycosyltransferase family 2 protein [Candidatus Woesebacteria bacterium]
MNISIVIPTWNGKKLLQKIIPGLLQLKSTEIIIVDNGSIDETAEYITQFPEITFITLSSNFGFTKAVNEGVKIAKSDYILILNNDCIITEQTITTLLQFLQQHNLVATQPVILKPDNSIENIGYIVDLTKGKAKIITRVEELSEIYKNHHILHQKEYIWKAGNMYGLSATCLLIKKDVFITIGMLKESFHSYLEDVDLFIRLNKKGYPYAPCTKVEVIHQHMSTSSKMGSYKQWHDFTNWIRIILGNYPRTFILTYFVPLTIERFRNLSGFVKKLIQ